MASEAMPSPPPPFNAETKRFSSPSRSQKKGGASRRLPTCVGSDVAERRRPASLLRLLLPTATRRSVGVLKVLCAACQDVRTVFSGGVASASVCAVLEWNTSRRRLRLDCPRRRIARCWSLSERLLPLSLFKSLSEGFTASMLCAVIPVVDTRVYTDTHTDAAFFYLFIFNKF